MIKEIRLDPIDLRQYKKLLEQSAYAEIGKLAKRLKGARILHLNTTTEGGVGEILKTLVPLLNGVGLEAHWFIFDRVFKQFFTVSKEIHNFLQGKKGDLTNEQKEIYLQVNEQIAGILARQKYDLYLIHDPQPAATIQFHPNLHPSIWRCHIDTSHTNILVWNFLSKFIKNYDRYIFTRRSYISPTIDYKKCRVFPVAIDPLSEKNNPLPKEKAREIVTKFGIDVSRPLVTQVSRFDPWKDPWGVIDAYRIAKKEVPDLQLALVGTLAPDDPESQEIFTDLTRYSKGDSDIHLLSNLDGVRAREINAFQVASDAIIQKSIREGFGLTVSEAMWKGKPVIGGKAGGIVDQIVDGETGFLVTTAVQAAQKIIYLLENPQKGAVMGAKGKEVVRHRFVTPIKLLHHLQLYDELI